MTESIRPASLNKGAGFSSLFLSMFRINQPLRSTVMHAFIAIILSIAAPVQAQLVSEMDDESKLYAETKQVNQFFRRFNGEEDEKGERYYPKDKQYRNVKLRKQYLGILFDAANTGIRADLKNEFSKTVLEKPIVLNFHGGSWFSEVRATFTHLGKDQRVVLFMELEKHMQGSRWVISRVHADFMDPYFQRDTTKVGQFLHPLSHELAFMNLRKAFNNRDSVSQYTVKRFRPDHLSVFLYEMRNGNMKFKSVEEVKFHFFQINDWYFELSEFNRPGYNSGWLISNLVKLNNSNERDLLRKYLFYEK
jgi:hypothetical protein